MYFGILSEWEPTKGIGFPEWPAEAGRGADRAHVGAGIEDSGV